MDALAIDSFLIDQVVSGLKMISDRVVAGTALIILSPLLGIVALLIHCTSKGPIFYHACRVGLNARPFLVIKFRTMVANADHQATITVGDDPRITSVGRILRASKIDELPQLWNILKGEMAIVGPRPESLSIVEKYYREEDKDLFSILPGLTCPGNLLYYVFYESIKPPKNMDWEEFYGEHLLQPKLLADRHYIQNRSFIYDIALIFQTVKIVAAKLMRINLRWTPKFASPPPTNWRSPQ